MVQSIHWSAACSMFDTLCTFEARIGVRVRAFSASFICSRRSLRPCRPHRDASATQGCLCAGTHTL